jgi:hypothetical protein
MIAKWYLCFYTRIGNLIWSRCSKGHNFVSIGLHMSKYAPKNMVLYAHYFLDGIQVSLRAIIKWVSPKWDKFKLGSYSTLGFMMISAYHIMANR